MVKSKDDPIALGWMAGFPPAADKLIRFEDGSYYAWPQLRWSFCHMEQLGPTKAVWRGAGASRGLTKRPMELSHLNIALANGETLSWTDMLASTYTDAFAILHRGELVYEDYFGACGPHIRHTLMSCNKSMVGTIAECLIDSGQLDPDTLVSEYVPELAGSAWGDATLRLVLDMQVGMRFHEDYLDPASDVLRFMRSTGMAPRRDGDPATIGDYLPNVSKEGEHAKRFAYREPNIFVLGWIIRRVTRQDLATLASNLVWQHIGAEHDWLYMVDASGAETTALATLRDFVRFGELILNRGRIAERQILPTAAIQSILGGGDQEIFAAGEYDSLPGWSYRSQWWVRHIDNAICPVARGAHGQVLYIDPAHDLVIARYGSSPEAPSSVLDPIIWPTIDAIVAELA
jgi:CubicO group peptidase (beta-lactamase class C family)